MAGGHPAHHTGVDRGPRTGRLPRRGRGDAVPVRRAGPGRARARCGGAGRARGPPLPRRRFRVGRGPVSGRPVPVPVAGARPGRLLPAGAGFGDRHPLPGAARGGQAQRCGPVRSQGPPVVCGDRIRPGPAVRHGYAAGGRHEEGRCGDEVKKRRAHGPSRCRMAGDRPNDTPVRHPDEDSSDAGTRVRRRCAPGSASDAVSRWARGSPTPGEDQAVVVSGAPGGGATWRLPRAGSSRSCPRRRPAGCAGPSRHGRLSAGGRPRGRAARRRWPRRC